MPSGDPSDFELLDAQLAAFYIGNRTRSTALLAWFIETVMREDPTDVEDAICDGGSDKGLCVIADPAHASERIDGPQDPSLDLNLGKHYTHREVCLYASALHKM